jgi:hypothetical protein
MQNADYQQWFQRWSAQMASNAATSKIPLGPIQTLASKPGRAAPKPGPAGPKVPPFGQGQAKKL